MATKVYKSPLEQARADFEAGKISQGQLDDVAIADFESKKYQPFKLDKQKYPDVEETPYGFIFNVGDKSITDIAEQDAKMFKRPATQNKGFTVTIGGDEAFYPDFESAYKAAKGVK